MAIFLIAFEAILYAVPGLDESCEWVFKIISFGVFSVSTLEYGVRLWISPLGSSKSPFRAFGGYALSFLGLVDLVVILP